MKFRETRISVRWAAAFVAAAAVVSSCLGEATVPDVMDGSASLNIILTRGDDSFPTKPSSDQKVVLSGDDFLSVTIPLLESDMDGSASTKALWKDGSNIYTFDDIRLGNPGVSLGVFGSFTSHGGSFSSPNLLDDVYFRQVNNSCVFNGPELNRSYSLNNDVKFWAYYPKSSSSGKHVGNYDGIGFESGRPYIDFVNDGDTGSTDADLLYGSTSVIYGTPLSGVSMSLNHAMSALWVVYSDNNRCDFGRIRSVWLEGIYTSGRFYLDGTWTNKVVVDNGSIEGYPEMDVDADGSDSDTCLISDDSFCIFLVPQTAPAGSKLYIQFDDGFSLRTMSADLTGLQFQMGKVYSLNVNLNFDSDGYVYLDLGSDDNTIHVPWQGGSYGYSIEDMDRWCTWCSCGNNCELDVEVVTNNGIVFSELMVEDGAYLEDYYNEDNGDGFYDFFRNGETVDCSRLMMVIAPNLNSMLPLEATIKILCPFVDDHKPYELHIVQDGNPNAGSYYIDIDDVVLPFSSRPAMYFELEGGQEFFTNLESSLYTTFSLCKNVKFNIRNTESSNGMNYNVYVSPSYDCSAIPIEVWSYDIISLYPNYSLSDVYIPYTVSIGSVTSNQAYIILKAGDYAERTLTLSPNPMELVAGASQSGIGYKPFTATYRFRLSGQSNYHTYTVPYFVTAAASTNRPNYGFLTVGNENIAYLYSNRFMSSRSITGNTTITVDFYDLSASGVVNVVGPALTVSRSLIYYDNDGASSSISVTSNTYWSILSKPSWLSLSGAVVGSYYSMNKSFTIVCPSNAGAPREGTMVLQTRSGFGSPVVTRTITIRQHGDGNIGMEGWIDDGTIDITW